MLHRNGTSPAPDAVRGRSADLPRATEFPPDRPIDTPRALAYHLSRQQLAGFPLTTLAVLPADCRRAVGAVAAKPRVVVCRSCSPFASGAVVLAAFSAQQ